MQGLSANKIAQKVHRDPKRVWDWLKDFEIQTRPRGTDYGQRFKKGQLNPWKGHHFTPEQREKLRQIALKDGRVPYLINGVHWLKATGRKPASWKGGTTPLRQAVYSSDIWKQCVTYVWHRDKATCQCCGKKFNDTDKSLSFHVHHLYSFAEYPYLRTCIDNLVLVCRDCHYFIHGKQNIKKIFLPHIGYLPKWSEFKGEFTLNILDQIIKDRYALYHGDSCEVLTQLPDNSIHYTITSPPFENLYVYSNSDRDMGNSRNDKEFFTHFKFMLKELYRVTMPGRLVSFHCMDLPLMKSRDGVIGLKDFPGQIIKALQECGFIYHSKVTIYKSPVVEMQRTKALGLLHKQIKKDSSMSRQGLPDYIVTVRKPGENPERITHTNESFPVDVWQNYASPVWMDIRQSDTLQRKSARAEKDEKHIAPLQLEVIQRCIELWTNPSDIVFDPFGGIGSTSYVALTMGRRAISSELKDSYFEQMKNNVEIASKMPIMDVPVGSKNIEDYIVDEQ